MQETVRKYQAKQKANEDKRIQFELERETRNEEARKRAEQKQIEIQRVLEKNVEKEKQRLAEYYEAVERAERRK
jgi:hypothetical protein